jgi:hypothetical protein
MERHACRDDRGCGVGVLRSQSEQSSQLWRYPFAVGEPLEEVLDVRHERCLELVDEKGGRGMERREDRKPALMRDLTRSLIRSVTL